MKRVLIVLPTSWDAKQLSACPGEVRDGYEIVWGEPSDDDCPSAFDVVAYIDRMIDEHGGRIDGVFSSSDYPGATVAAAIASRLGLPGPDPAVVIRCSHKYYSRIAQREAVPDATPAFALVRPGGPAPDLGPVGYPCFIKPVKGAFSIMSGRLDGPTDLTAFLARPETGEFARDYVAIFNRLVARFTDFTVDGSWFLVEEFLHGVQVTVEGYVRGGVAMILGVVDSITHPGTPSFARFDYPSAVRPEIQAEMGDIASRAIAHLGLDDSFFNIEMIYDPSGDRIRIIEINPRICGQFADLYRKVDGRGGYEIALALATGTPLPDPLANGRFTAATSFPLRTFEPVRVADAPTDARIEATERNHPGTLVWCECRAGQELSDFVAEDGHSVRYGVVNVGAGSRRGLRERLHAVHDDLGFRFEAVEGTPGS